MQYATRTPTRASTLRATLLFDAPTAESEEENAEVSLLTSK